MPASAWTVSICSVSLQRAWPVVFEKARKRSVGQDTSARLATRAIVAFVLGVDDPLDRGAAHRTRLPEASVDGHRVMKRRDLLRKRPLQLPSQLINPDDQRRARRVVQPRDLVGTQRLRQLQRGETCRVKNLVGVSVADAAEQMRIGERPLQRVILTPERGAELIQRRFERLDAAWIMAVERGLTAYDLDGSPFLRAGFRQVQSAVRKYE